MTRRLVRRALPGRVRYEVFRARRLGLRKALAYRRLEGRRPRPVACEGFDIGGRWPIVVDESAVHTVASHWVDYGHSIKELEAFKRIRVGCSAFFDIGAAEGIFSAAFCALGDGTAWAFEPSPRMQARLARTCELNPEFDIRTVHVALGDQPSTRGARFYEDGQLSVVAEAGDLATTSVEIDTLERVARELAVRPDLVKIDVEGMELAVLRGAGSALADARHILLEVHYDQITEHGESLRDVVRTIAAVGMELYDLDLTPIADLERFVRDEPEMIPGYTIVVASRERLDRLSG